MGRVKAPLCAIVFADVELLEAEFQRVPLDGRRHDIVPTQSLLGEVARPPVGESLSARSR